MLFLRFAWLALVACSFSCGDAPKPVRGNLKPMPSPEAGVAPVAVGDSRAELPPAHPVIGNDAGPEIVLAGEVVLVGELAERDGGSFFVSVRATGSRSTWLTRRYDLAEAHAAEGGARELHFELRSRDPEGLTFNFAPSSAGVPEGECEVHVRFSEEPYVESPVLAEAAVAFRPGETHYRLVLGSDG